jgi:hypothetical protein
LSFLFHTRALQLWRQSLATSMTAFAPPPASRRGRDGRPTDLLSSENHTSPRCYQQRAKLHTFARCCCEGKAAVLPTVDGDAFQPNSRCYQRSSLMLPAKGGDATSSCRRWYQQNLFCIV